MHYNFFRIDYLKLSILVAVFLLVGAVYGGYKEAVLVCLVFVLGSFAVDFLGWVGQKRHKKGSVVESGRHASLKN